MSAAEIKKQVEYYLSDGNLSKDEFFRDMIEKHKEGYLSFEVIMKCNKVKKMGIKSVKELAEACKNSDAIEVSKDGKMVRRANNKALPEKTGNLRKRDAKAEEKKVSKEAKEEEEKGEPVERDEKGRIIFCQKDFENTLIVHFKTEDIDEDKDKDYKVNWKDLEGVINEQFNQIKVVYSRADKYEGDLAISRFKMNKD